MQTKLNDLGNEAKNQDDKMKMNRGVTGRKMW